MRTLFVTDPPPPVEDWLAHRHALGQDRFDEVWEGEYHVAPAPHWRHARVEDEVAAVLRPLAAHAGLHGGGPCSIGTAEDYRVPNRAYLRADDGQLWNPTAAIVVEIVSPGDESRRKLDFYGRAGIEELLVVDPDERTVEWFIRGPETSSRRTAAGSWPSRAPR